MEPRIETQPACPLGDAVAALMGYEAWHSVDSQLATAFDTIVVEVSVPLVELGLRAGDQVKLAIALGHDGAIEERHPPSGALTFRLARQQD